MEIFMADDGIVVESLQPQQVEQVAKPVVEEVTEPTGTASEEGSTEQTDAVEKPKEEKPKDEPIPKGVQKRIDRAVRQKYEAEARANELERRLRDIETKQPEQRQASNDEPKLENYNDLDEFITAKARWIAKSEFNETLTARERVEAEKKAQAAQVESAERWAKSVAQATAELPDFDDVVGASDIRFRDPVTLQAIQASDVGAKIAYYLASNPDEADEIASLTGMAAIKAIGRLEAKLENQKPVVTNTPPPIKPVGQSAKVSKAPHEMSFDEFAKWRKAQIARR